MRREQVITELKECGIVAVVRADSQEQAEKITEACIEGGVGAIEITFTTPGAHKIIEALVAKYGKSGKIIIGAGTVLDTETCRTAILAGSQFIVSPHFNAEIVKMCNRYGIANMAGAITPTEVVSAMEAGTDIIKVFPGELFGPAIIKALKAPFPQANIMPTGGVSVDNVAEWIKAGACAVGAGSSLTAGAKTGDWAAITAAGRAFREKIVAARAK